ncbi:MAG: spermidine/putrescine ABC transporter substrate-binding protein [Treponema sp.]|jgi:spermidine/putrescine-binding protein|nr:spermidine/putrescine ABC transporter substrate-binding protein [Treponema sp.]
MNKLRLTAIAVIFCVFPLAQVSAQNKEFVIYTWEGMFPPKVLNDFERANPGVKVVYKTFEYNEDMLDELISSDGTGYDLVIADDYILDFIVQLQLAQKLVKSSIRNLGNIDPMYQHQFYDPNDEYTIPYGAGIQTIVYDPSKVGKEITGYADLWDSSLRGKVGIIGNYRVINGMALKTMRYSYNTNDLAQIREAGNRLKTLAPNIGVINDSSLEQDLLAGGISAAVMYTDQVMRSKLQKPSLKVVFPQEGLGFGIMPAFIPAGSSNAALAYKFLDFILDPRRGAECFEYLGYYCTYSASYEYIKQELRNFLILPKEFINFEMIKNLSQTAEDEHYRIWTEFLTVVNR